MTAETLRTRLRHALWLTAEEEDAVPSLRPQAVLPLLLLVVLALGVNWPVMAVALRSLSSLWTATLRLVAATGTLFLLTGVSRRLTLPRRRDYSIVLSVAAFRLAAVFILVLSALEIVPPGRSSILVWTASLWTVPIAAVFIGERMTPLRWAGLLVGVAGILLVFEPTRFDWTDGRTLAGHAMLLGAALSQASVSVHVRRHRWASTPLNLLPWQLLTATLPMLAVALAIEGVPDVAWSFGLVANLLFQGSVVSGFAIWGQLTVLRSHPAVSTNIVLMAVPVIGLLSSALLLDEALSAWVLVGLGLVLAGVILSRLADA
jgi:drug/metabolite transporter (DMT)-like permease